VYIRSNIHVIVVSCQRSDRTAQRGQGQLSIPRVSHFFYILACRKAFFKDKTKLLQEISHLKKI